MGLLPKNIEPDKYLGKGVEYLGYGVVLILIVFGFSFYAILTKTLSLGDLGSYLAGGIGSIIGLLVAVFTFLAFYVQYDANKKIQQQFKVQQFESQFYKMVDLYKSSVDEFDIPFYDTIDNDDTIFEWFQKTSEKEAKYFFRELRGKTCFVDMVKELEFCLEATKLVVSKDKPSIYHYELAFKIFFFGVHSEIINNKKVKYDTLSKQLIAYLKKEQKNFKENEKPFFRRNVKIRYVPFQGHESRLGHYYRHLFQTVKYVAFQEKELPIKYGEAKQYLRLLRAQMSNAEQLLLYYNYICGFGNNWDRLGKNGYQFLTKYRMIHNMPVDRVKVVENPRHHFKEYICNHCTEKDELFEWGDKREELKCNE